MKIGLLGKKLGMTRIFRDDGQAEVVTVIRISPSMVTGIRTKEKNGYDALQLGTGAIKDKKVNKPLKGFFTKGNIPAQEALYEIRLNKSLDGVSVGDTITLENFEVGDFVDISGNSIGKGFQGVMKRHNFHGGRGSHGDKTGRRTGSIGQSAYPSRVFKGMKNPGRMGGKKVTVQNLKVIDIDLENELLVVRGAVPGATDSMVKVFLSLKEGKDKDLKVSTGAEQKEETPEAPQEEVSEEAAAPVEGDVAPEEQKEAKGTASEADVKE